jgi:hypothetical protein
VDDEGRYLNPPKIEPIAIRCHGCDQKEKFQDSLPKNTSRGVYVAFRKFDPDNPIVDEVHVRTYEPPPDDLDFNKLRERGWGRTPYTNRY